MATWEMAKRAGERFPVHVLTAACDAFATGDCDNDGIPNVLEAGERRNPQVKDNDVFTSARLFSMQQFRDFLGREGDVVGIASWTSYLSAGNPRAAVVETFLKSPQVQDVISPIARLYFAYFLRVPDFDGLRFWIARYRHGNSLDSISQSFAASAEFQSRYGSLDDARFVDLVYQNVLRRVADPAGRAYWISRLGGGLTRGHLMTEFSESPEYATEIASEVYVTMTYFGMLQRAPDSAGLAYWVGVLDAGSPRRSLIDAVLTSAEYRSRFLP